APFRREFVGHDALEEFWSRQAGLARLRQMKPLDAGDGVGARRATSITRDITTLDLMIALMRRSHRIPSHSRHFGVCIVSRLSDVSKNGGFALQFRQSCALLRAGARDRRPEESSGGIPSAGRFAVILTAQYLRTTCISCRARPEHALKPFDDSNLARFR